MVAEVEDTAGATINTIRVKETISIMIGANTAVIEVEVEGISSIRKTIIRLRQNRSRKLPNLKLKSKRREMHSSLVSSIGHLGSAHKRKKKQQQNLTVIANMWRKK